MAAMARARCAVFPHLRDVRVVRAWSALRVMSPDGLPDLRAIDGLSGRIRRHLPQRRDARCRSCARDRRRAARGPPAVDRVHPLDRSDSMFARLPDIAAAVPIVIDGVSHLARAGDTVAAALLACGRRRLPHHRGVRCAARALLPHGRVLRVHGRGRRRGSARLPRAASCRACASSRARRERAVRPEPTRRRDRRRRARGTRGCSDVRAARPVGARARRAGRRPADRSIGRSRRSPLPARNPRRRLLEWRRADRRRSCAPVHATAAHDGVGASRRRRRLRAGHEPSQRDEQRAAVAIDARAVDPCHGRARAAVAVRGWTLPGVMMAGGAQALAQERRGGAAADAPCSPAADRCCGSWPRSTCVPACASTRCSTPRRAGVSRSRWRHAPAFMASPYFAKGRELVRYVRRRTRVVEYVDALAIEGVTAVTGRPLSSSPATRSACRRPGAAAPGRRARRQPRVGSGLPCRMERATKPASHRSSTRGAAARVPGLYIAGDGGGIAGADAAVARGALAGLAVANAWVASTAGCVTAKRVITARALDAAMRGRRFLDVLYRPADGFRRPVGWHACLPLRGGHRRNRARARPWRRGRPQPDEGAHALRNGTVPGAVLRPHGHRAHGGGNGTLARRRRDVSMPFSCQARAARRGGRDAGHGG